MRRSRRGDRRRHAVGQQQFQADHAAAAGIARMADDQVGVEDLAHGRSQVGRPQRIAGVGLHPRLDDGRIAGAGDVAAYALEHAVEPRQYQRLCRPLRGEGQDQGAKAQQQATHERILGTDTATVAGFVA